MKTTRRRSTFAPSLSELEGRQLMSVTAGGTIPPGIQALINNLQTLENNLLSAASHSHNQAISRLDTALAHSLDALITRLENQFGGGTSTGGGTTTTPPPS